MVVDEMSKLHGSLITMTTLKSNESTIWLLDLSYVLYILVTFHQIKDIFFILLLPFGCSLTTIVDKIIPT